MLNTAAGAPTSGSVLALMMMKVWVPGQLQIGKKNT